MHCGGGVTVRKTFGEPIFAKRLRLTSFRLLVTAYGLNQTPVEGQYSLPKSGENSGSRRNHALETLVCPRPGLLNAVGCVNGHS
jgi:hypothetical protein